jgi:hypothetical protein
MLGSEKEENNKDSQEKENSEKQVKMGIGPLDYGRVVACCYAIGVFDVGKLGPLNYGGVLACYYKIDVFGVGNHTQDLFYKNLFSS